MADIELVVKLDEEEYINIKNAINSLIGNGVERASMSKVCLAILDGTPLPKGHGRLIDADKFLKDNEAYTGFILDSRFFGGKNAYKDALEDLVNEAPTIIEADMPKRKKGTPLEENDSGYNCENWIP